MKAFILGIVFLVVVAIGGYFALQYIGKSGTAGTVYKTAAITRTGTLQKSTAAGTDFTHILISAGASYGVASYSQNLDQYVGKNVKVTGQNSGTTLYIDTVTVIQ
jgi:hypothetical protein